MGELPPRDDELASPEDRLRLLDMKIANIEEELAAAQARNLPTEGIVQRLQEARDNKVAEEESLALDEAA